MIRLPWLPSALAGLTLFVLFAQGPAAPAHAQAQATLRKGPYLMAVGPRSVAVLFELSGIDSAEVVAEAEGAPTRHVESPANDFHELVLEGLTPATAYDYRVELGTRGKVAEGHFTTAPEDGEGPIRFLVVGDNRTDAIAHGAVIERMLEHPADFVLNTGDMVNDGSDQEDWQRMFDVQGPLLRDLPLFPTLGNHELYRGGVGLPSFLRYTRVPQSHGGGDTYYAFTYGPVRFIVLDSNDDWSVPGPQRRWLGQQLEAARSDSKVAHIMVAMHHGPYSSGHHGNHPFLVDAGVADLLRRRGVALVLSGHDHAYERGDADGLKYIVTGGGGAPLYEENRALASQQRFEATYHFVEVGVDGSRVEITARRVDGSQIERCRFESNLPWECEGGSPSGPAEAAPPGVPSAQDGPTWGTGTLVATCAIALASILGLLFWRSRRSYSR